MASTASELEQPATQQEIESAPALEAARSSPSKPLVGIPAALHCWERYQVLEILGSGGMGAVYKARDPRLDRWVAIKLVHPRLGHGPGSSGDRVSRRFQREAQLQAALEHPNICKIPARCRNSDEVTWL